MCVCVCVCVFYASVLPDNTLKVPKFFVLLHTRTSLCSNKTELASLSGGYIIRIINGMRPLGKIDWETLNFLYKC